VVSHLHKLSKNYKLGLLEVQQSFLYFDLISSISNITNLGKGMFYPQSKSEKLRKVNLGIATKYISGQSSLVIHLLSSNTHNIDILKLAYELR